MVDDVILLDKKETMGADHLPSSPPTSSSKSGTILAVFLCFALSLALQLASYLSPLHLPLFPPSLFGYWWVDYDLLLLL